MGSPMKLVSTLDLVRRATQSDIAYTLSRMRVLERIPGNPIGIAFREIDETSVAFMAKNLPSPSFNRAVGLRAEHEPIVASLVAWYREHESAGCFVLEPGYYSEGLGRRLVELGYCPSGFHATLIGEPASLEPPPAGFVIERVATAAAMEDYLDAYVAGWGLAARDHEGFKANVRPWLDEPGWSLYLARIDNRPAAAAALFVRGATAYCADAATDPAFRRRGLQAALLRRRLQDAGAAGADFVWSGAEYLSTSHRNMERVGMRLLSMRTVWKAG